MDAAANELPPVATMALAIVLDAGLVIAPADDGGALTLLVYLNLAVGTHS